MVTAFSPGGTAVVGLGWVNHFSLYWRSCNFVGAGVVLICIRISVKGYFKPLICALSGIAGIGIPAEGVESVLFTVVVINPNVRCRDALLEILSAFSVRLISLPGTHRFCFYGGPKVEVGEWRKQIQLACSSLFGLTAIA